MNTPPAHQRRTALICLLLILIATGVRWLSWQDNRFEAAKVEWVVAAEYQKGALLLSQGDVSTYLHDLSYMTHPPGYALLRALILKTFGDSDTAVQTFQILADAVAAILVFLIVSWLTCWTTGTIAGLLVAISPQLAYYPSLLLPDSLSVLPILLAIFCLVLAYRRPRAILLLLAGIFVGLSCWLRANALLLCPFLAAIVPLLFQRGRRLRYSAALLLGTILVIAPLTIKNLILFHRFIPLSLGAGQKLLEGIAEYDQDGRFGIPKTDLGIMRQEAENSNRPEYLEGLFAGDGVERDHMRTMRALTVIRTYPIWYLGVMGRRSISFLRLARVPPVSARPAYSASLEVMPGAKPVWSASPDELLGSAAFSPGSTRSMTDDSRWLSLIGDDSKDGAQLTSPPIAVHENTNYLIRTSINLSAGRLLTAVTTQDQRPLYSTIVDAPDAAFGSSSAQMVNLPLASDDASFVRFALSNAGAKPRVLVGTTEMFEEGPTLHRWTRYPRILIHILETPFITACMLPVALAGIALLALGRRWRELAILLIVPVYYLCVQSALHTERRYVIAIHYFLFSLSAVPVGVLISNVWQRWPPVRRHRLAG